MDKITFRVHKDGWVMVSELFDDKVVIRYLNMDKKPYRVQDTRNQHRSNEMVLEGSVKIQPKRYDISKFMPQGV